MGISKNSKIYVAGHNGMVGSAIVRILENKGYNNLILKSRKELDLTNLQSVKYFYELYKPDYVFICAAKVGGIHANNTYPAEFIYNNLQIQSNLIHFAHINKIKKLLFLGSSCIYPKRCPQPMREDYLLSGPLEKTNEAYAIAKIAGIKMCASYHRQYKSQFFSIMPANTYGANDNYDLETSHVMAALIRKIFLAKCLQEKNFKAIRKNLQFYPISHNVYFQSTLTNNDIICLLKNYGVSIINNHEVCVKLWGTGKPLREFIHVDDIASGALFIMNKNFNTFYKQGFTHINVGTGEEVSIAMLAKIISNEIGYKGEINFNKKMPDGAPRKCMDMSLINKQGWKSKIDLKNGISKVYQGFLNK